MTLRLRVVDSEKRPRRLRSHFSDYIRELIAELSFAHRQMFPEPAWSILFFHWLFVGPLLTSLGHIKFTLREFVINRQVKHNPVGNNPVRAFFLAGQFLRLPVLFQSAQYCVTDFTSPQLAAT